MKKFLLLLLSLMLVFAFVACDLGGDDGDDDDADATPTPAATATPAPTATPPGATPTPAPTANPGAVDLTAASDSDMGAGTATYNSTEGRLELVFDGQYSAWGRNFYDAARDKSAYSSIVIDAEIVDASTNFSLYVCNGDYDASAAEAESWGWDSVGRDTLTIDLSAATIDDVYQVGVKCNTAGMNLYIYSITFVE